MRFETQTVEVLLSIALTKTPIGFELPLRLGREFRRKHDPGYSTDMWCVKCGNQPLQPVWMKQYIVIRVSYDIAGRAEGARITSDVQAGSILRTDVTPAANATFRVR